MILDFLEISKMKFRGPLLTKTWKMGHFQYISVDCGHTNFNIAIEVNTDIYHDVYYNCAEFEGNRQS
jgi:hypothetical protein